ETRVHPALDRIDEILRHELAPLAPEGGVIGEKYSRLDAYRPRRAAIRDLGRTLRSEGHQLRRAAQVIPFVEAFENRPVNRVRIAVVDLVRVQPVDVRLRKPQN